MQRKGEWPDRRRTRRISRIVCIVSAELLSDAHRTRRPSRRSETDLRDNESYRPVWTTSLHQRIRSTRSENKSHQRIRSTRSDNKFAPANQIKPFGQQVAPENQIDPFGQQVAPANQIDPFRQQVSPVNPIDPSGQQDHSRSLRPLYYSYILRCSRK